MDYVDCGTCNGTGYDDVSFDGWCIACSGHGQVEVDAEDDEATE